MRINPVNSINSITPSTPAKATSFTANPVSIVANVAEDSGITKFIIKGYQKIFDRPWFGKVDEFLSKHKFLGGNKLYTHMLTVGSIITSGTCAIRTLKNDKLDKDRRQTLAVNQALVLVTSAAGNYALDGALNNWWTKQTGKFKAAQIAKGFTENLDAKVAGMDIFKRAMIFGLIYRYITPVIVTPIANKIGDKIIANKKAKEAAAAQAA